MKQTLRFKSHLADEFFDRIKDKDFDHKIDPIVKILDDNLKGKSLLEIGCGTGSRLNFFKKNFRLGRCVGIEPSGKAVSHASENFSSIEFYQGTADDLRVIDGSFDIIVFGFCLYLCDRKDLFKIASETDGKLNENGQLIIFDFYTPFPYKNRYLSLPDTFSYKQDYSKIFDAMPWYCLRHKNVFSASENYIAKGEFDNKHMVCVFDKISYEAAYLGNPYE